MKERNYLILNGKIPSTLFRLTLPSIFGMFGMMIFNIVDTFYVGKLGATELAAISFTFPVVMVLNSLVFGIGTAAMALFSRASGQQDTEEKQFLATSTFTLGLSMSISMGIIGYFTIDPLFRAMGADDQLLVYIKDFMKIWYMGAGFMVIPMLGDSILRGLGDTVVPAAVMMIVAMLNVILDPLMIFGIGPFPMMGIRGAALATVIARGIAAIISILIQIYREHLLTFKAFRLSILRVYWKKLFHIGIPNSAVRAITPFGTALFTSILATFGHEIVAGYGVGTKVESVFLAFINASTITATVFVGQNLGAGNLKRAKEGLRILRISLFCLGLFIALIFFFSGGFIAGFFNENMLVRSTTALYLSIVPIGYGFLAMTQISAAVMNVYHKPLVAAGLSLFQIGIIAVPSALLFSRIFSQAGVFMGILAGFVITGSISFIVLNKYSNKFLAE